MSKRQIDVIDVNRRWSAWVGSRRHGYNVGTVRAHDRMSALRAARASLPGTRVSYVEEETL